MNAVHRVRPKATHLLRFLACELARPAIRLLPAGRVRVLEWIAGPQDSTFWKHHPKPIREFWDRDLGAWIQADLRDWGGRWHYYAGRYYDQVVPWVIRRYLREGDWFIDVGANLGMHTLRAAKTVGRSGRVVSLEPSPFARDRLEWHVWRNGLDQVVVVPAAVGRSKGKALLRHEEAHLGTGTLRARGVDDRFTRSTEVCVGTLDHLLPQPTAEKRVLVKIDVEGFEADVVHGASQWIARSNTAFIIEVTPQWVASNGHSVDEIFDAFARRGYQAYLLERRRGWYSEGAALRQVYERPPGQRDYLFAKDGF